MQFRALIIDSFRESMDRKIFWVISAMTLSVVLTMICIGFEPDKVTFAFGLWNYKTTHYDPTSVDGVQHLIGFIVYLLTFTLLGWLGVILMVISTAGMFPRMLSSGSVDILLSKPLSRPKLFIFKYLASMTFVLFHATAFVVLTFLVMGLRWGVWVPAYLLSIVLLVILFSYVFSVSVLAGIKTRSTPTAILLGLFAWFSFSAPFSMSQIIETFPTLKDNIRLRQGIQVARWILPKTSEIPYIAARWCGAGTEIDSVPTPTGDGALAPRQEHVQLSRRLEKDELQRSPLLSIGSSLLFEGVVVLWAMISFARKDY